MEKSLYKNYISTHFGNIHKKTRDEFKLYYTYFKKNYYNHLPVDRGAKILDIGCGMGHFLFFLQKEGYTNYLGVDISEENIEFCKNCGFNVFLDDIFDYFAKSNEHFDVIVMNDVIEHLNKEEILSILLTIYDHLNSGGSLIIKAPNAANPIIASSLRYDDFTHQIMFTEESLSQILSIAGFNTITIYRQNLYVFYNNPLNYIAILISWLLSIFFRLLFIMYGHPTTKIFTKNIISVAKK